MQAEHAICQQDLQSLTNSLSKLGLHTGKAFAAPRFCPLALHEPSLNISFQVCLVSETLPPLSSKHYQTGMQNELDMAEKNSEEELSIQVGIPKTLSESVDFLALRFTVA